MNLVIAAAQCHSTVGNVTNNVAHHRRFGILAAECGVQLLVFPELSLTGYDLAIARANALSADASWQARQCSAILVTFTSLPLYSNQTARSRYTQSSMSTPRNYASSVPVLAELPLLSVT
jgi:predicted amidohydrolase